MTAPRRCKSCNRSRKDLKGASDIPVQHQSSLWESGNGDLHCWACVGRSAAKLFAKLNRELKTTLDNASQHVL